MSKTKKHIFLWLSSGLFFSLLAFIVIFRGLAGKVLIVDPEGVGKTTNAVMASIRTGDWKALEQLVDGNPPLVLKTGDNGSVESLIWDRYQESLHWVCEENYGIQGSHVTQRITVTCLDISGVTDQMAQSLLVTAENTENRNTALLAAAEAALTTEVSITERQVTLTFVRTNGQWRVLADQGLLSLVSGFTAH